MLNQSARYFVPDPSHWPILGSAALLSMASGAALWMNEATWGKFVLIAGVCMLFLMMFGWFGSVARESEGGRTSRRNGRRLALAFPRNSRRWLPGVCRPSIP